jgi:2-keto-4-pentenoate hydratase/2-oxohepta-3-ene-1,7-dioic acid hydratase in catechol pathway
MKLATFSTADNREPRLGLVTDRGLVDLAQVDGLPGSMADYLADHGASRDRIAAAADGPALDLTDVHLHAPIPNPGKVLAIGLNYGDHVAESGMEKPKHQVWFNKQHNCINGPYDDIDLPVVSDKLDYEAELCLVIGRRCRHVPRDRAHEVIAGYFCGNDVSVRDWQLRVQTFQIGKSFDTHGPIGPYLVTPDEVGDPHDLGIRCLVNGEMRQESNTKHLIFDCFDAVEHLTQAFTLDPGDVLFMGTPAGVGVAMQPPKFLKAGDVVRVEIDKLGHIENTVAAETGGCIIE